MTMTELKSRQRDTWAAGDYSVIGTTLQIVGEDLCERLDLDAGSTVLDVAAGNGNASLAAARRGCRVTATDYVPALLELTAARARVEGLSLEVQEADAEALPFADDSFDTVVSTFGVMFAPDQEQATAELLRVCRPGGRIGLANWTPTGYVGQLFRTIGAHVPPPVGVASPLLWGTVTRLEELFGTGATVTAAPRDFVFRYRSAEDWLNTFRTYYGPMVRAFAALDADGRAALEQDLLTLARGADSSRTGSLRMPAQYLEVVVTKV